eukprot:TRINITY_DN4949_c0_g1_i1.p1 TRINITY_DN4949_c0_g1~~TRINITY_DN4949_c0_g1_i1.p1  ORF type:complete len:313 (+),score=56.13 TRINITY_DN4949_c0_g1_i1:675-1613(+)
MTSNRLRLVSFHSLSRIWVGMGRGISTREPLPTVGAIVGDHVVDFSLNDALPKDMKGFLEGGPEVINEAQKYIKEVESGDLLNFSEVKIRAPLTNPQKVLCVGLNYLDHAKESNLPVPSEPLLFSKFPSAIIGPNDEIIKPKVTDQLDYEVELVVVIGKKTKDVSVEDALSYVGGYTVGNDVSARDWQLKKGGQWLSGKSFDTFAPIGPSILINPLWLSGQSPFDPNNLGIRCFLNDKPVQNSNTKEFVFNVQQIVSYASRIFTLFPGDIIFTGTPPGVGMGKTPPLWMVNGDKVRCEIDELGALDNSVVEK